MKVSFKKIETSQKALLLIDIQEDYTGVLAKPPFPYKDSELLIATLNKLIKKSSDKNIIIVYIKHEFEGFFGKLLTTFFGHRTAIKGAPGTELDERINILSNNIFTKSMPSAFSNPALEEFLVKHQVNELLITGLDASRCVNATAKGALKRGYNVTIVTDCIATKNPSGLDNLLNQFKKKGISLMPSEKV